MRFSCFKLAASFALLLSTFLCTGVRAQTVIAVMDFDGTTPEMTIATDVPFFDDGANGFFGIRDTNDDPNDGTPTDTGDGNNGGYPEITAGFLSGDYLLVEDLDNSDGQNGGPPQGTAGVATVTFGPVDISGQSGVSFSFDYQIVGFASTEVAVYEIFVDGVGQGPVNLREGFVQGETNQGSIAECILEGAATVSLELRLEQNGNDQAAFDNFTVTANTGCNPVCGIDLDATTLSLLCAGFTEGTDAVTGSINYFGIETGVTVAISGGGTLSADSNDPATEEGGTQANAREIRFENLAEGGTYTVSITGNACTGDQAQEVTFTVPTDLCQPIGDVVINEFLASLDGGPVGEFIELFNRGTEAVDVSGYTIEDGSGERSTIPAGTVLQPTDGYVFADAPTSNGGCLLQEVFGLSLNDDGDVIILRNAGGAIVHQVSYDGTDLTAGVSRALSPDGNIDGGYQNHTDVSDTQANSSPCSENIDNEIALPVTLLSFTAEATGKTVELTWVTANEVNNDRFEVQRSATADRWTTLGAVAAAGGRNAEQAYFFTDRAPANGTTYYRLRQIDADGTATLSAPVSVTYAAASFGVYPNPAGAELWFTAPLAAADEAAILSADGKLIRTATPTGNSVRVADLAAGLYLLRVVRKNGTELVRFVKR